MDTRTHPELKTVLRLDSDEVTLSVLPCTSFTLVVAIPGLLGVDMPMFYGKGWNAFRRLQPEILQTTNDHSIFSGNSVGFHSNVLADGPEFFGECHQTVKMEARRIP